MPKELEDALLSSFKKGKRKGKLKGVDEGQYVFGSKPMMKAMGRKKKRHEGVQMEMFEKGK